MPSGANAHVLLVSLPLTRRTGHRQTEQGLDRQAWLLHGSACATGAQAMPAASTAGTTTAIFIGQPQGSLSAPFISPAARGGPPGRSYGTSSRGVGGRLRG